MLGALRHPGIVRYIADGRTRAGELWLAMEWLEGESVQQRLARAGLTATESIALVRRVSEALGAAHERGVVHRDVKPSNLWLTNGELERVKVLDFGVARITGGDRNRTRTGVMIGTPGYMAPEQARGDRDIGPRADVFALGCLLFECLTGRVVFVGDNIMAVLAKILLEDAPRIGELRPDLPRELDELVARTLAKQPAARPKDGGELAAALEALGTVDATERPAAGPWRPSLTATERRLLCVVLVGGGGDPVDTIAEIATWAETPVKLDAPDAPTIAGDAAPGADMFLALREAAAEHGAGLERLVDGSHVVTLAGSGSAGDQAIQAARCALALKAIAPAAPMALATGRGVMAGRWPVGEAIDRAARLLGPARRASPHLVRVDEITAGLLDTRFDVGGDEAGLYVIGERDVVEVARTLLGKPTPCVGRDRELGVLFGLFEECVAEPMARAVLVTGAAGIGKSRVRHELLGRIKDRGEPVEIWIGRGDPLRTGSPFGMIAPALRRAAGILDGEPVEVRRQKLRARVTRHASTDLLRTTQFLGELIGTPFPDDDVALRSARQDPLVMGEQIRRAFEHLISVETSAQPLVIVLDDLHWGDLPTVKLIDAALRALSDRPWLVLALARPEIYELFPRLWAERGLQELRLDDLTKKGSERLVRRVLGEQTSDSLVARLVEQAGGNAFYLEELIRAAAEGKGDAMPETVLAVVQSRLERLEVDARRILRAASVFGQHFWRGGVAALTGSIRHDEWIDELVEREVVGRVASSRFPGEDELQFRHALVREGAYAMLTDADRRLGHQLAGDWLERAGEGDPMVLGEHFERGGDRLRAVDSYRYAAEQALSASDFRGAADRAERAVACGAQGVTLGALRLAQAEAHKWCGEFADAARHGIAAMELVPVASTRWFLAANEAAEASGRLGDVATLTSLGEALRDAPASRSETIGARILATANAAFQLLTHGDHALALVLLDHVERHAGQVDEPAIVARIYQARSSRAMITGDAGAYLESEQAAAVAFEQAGDLRFACMQRGHVGYACLEIGAYAEAERALRDALEVGTRLGLHSVVATAKHNLGRALQARGLLDEALAIETEALESFHAQGDRRLEGASRCYLSNILLERGELDAAGARDPARTRHRPGSHPAGDARAPRARVARAFAPNRRARRGDRGDDDLRASRRDRGRRVADPARDRGGPARHRRSRGRGRRDRQCPRSSAGTRVADQRSRVAPELSRERRGKRAHAGARRAARRDYGAEARTLAIGVPAAAARSLVRSSKPRRPSSTTAVEALRSSKRPSRSTSSVSAAVIRWGASSPSASTSLPASAMSPTSAAATRACASELAAIGPVESAPLLASWVATSTSAAGSSARQ